MGSLFAHAVLRQKKNSVVTKRLDAKRLNYCRGNGKPLIQLENSFLLDRFFIAYIITDLLYLIKLQAYRIVRC
jgi:hypothetical protein